MIKALFTVVIMAVATITVTATAQVFIQMDRTITDYNQSQADGRVIIGHRIGPGGQEQLIYAE